MERGGESEGVALQPQGKDCPGIDISALYCTNSHGKI